jgi:hypothetical protein
MSWLCTDVQKYLQNSKFCLNHHRSCSPLFVWVGVLLVYLVYQGRPSSCEGGSIISRLFVGGRNYLQTGEFCLAEYYSYVNKLQWSYSWADTRLTERTPSPLVPWLRCSGASPFPLRADFWTLSVSVRPSRRRIVVGKTEATPKLVCPGRCGCPTKLAAGLLIVALGTRVKLQRRDLLGALNLEFLGFGVGLSERLLLLEENPRDLVG